MRVIAGKHRSRTLAEFKGRDIRPTADRAKEALFNILQTRIVGCSFLDLFSGTGGIGIEAISRGADNVVFVDRSPESVALIKRNLSSLHEEAKVVTADAVSYIETSRDKFDIVFLDPPYEADGAAVVAKLAERKSLNDGGIIIYEHSGDSAGEIDGLQLVDFRRYGIAVFDIYREV